MDTLWWMELDEINIVVPWKRFVVDSVFPRYIEALGGDRVGRIVFA